MAEVTIMSMRKGSGGWMWSWMLLLVMNGVVSLSQHDVRPVLHAIAGRVLTEDTGRAPITVSLAYDPGNPFAQVELDYSGAFFFDSLSSGRYLLTITRPGFASVGRPVEIKTYSAPKTVTLEIRLKEDQSATIQEVVREYTKELPKGREEELSRVSKNAAKHFQKAQEQSQKGNRDKAIEFLKKAIHAEPNFFEAYNNLGVQYQALKRWDPAIDAFRKAASIREDAAKPHLNLAIILHHLGRLDEAVESYRKAIHFDGNLAVAHQGLGQVFVQKGRFDLAREHLERATRLAPRETRPAFILLIQMGLERSDSKSARFFLTQFQQYFPGDEASAKLTQKLQDLISQQP